MRRAETIALGGHEAQSSTTRRTRCLAAHWLFSAPATSPGQPIIAQTRHATGSQGFRRLYRCYFPCFFVLMLLFWCGIALFCFLLSSRTHINLRSVFWEVYFSVCLFHLLFFLLISFISFDPHRHTHPLSYRFFVYIRLFVFVCFSRYLKLPLERVPQFTLYGSASSSVFFLILKVILSCYFPVCCFIFFVSFPSLLSRPRTLAQTWSWFSPTDCLFLFLFFFSAPPQVASSSNYSASVLFSCYFLFFLLLFRLVSCSLGAIVKDHFLLSSQFVYFSSCFFQFVFPFLLSQSRYLSLSYLV